MPDCYPMWRWAGGELEMGRREGGGYGGDGLEGGCQIVIRCAFELEMGWGEASRNPRLLSNMSINDNA